MSDGLKQPTGVNEMIKNRTLIGMALGVLAASASAQLIVGNDQTGTATIYKINVSTGVATPLIASATSATKPWGMAADNAGGMLYWNSGTALYKSSFSDLNMGLIPGSSVPITFGTATTSMVALAWDPTTQKLVGTKNVATEAVYEIDPVTGVATQLYTYNTGFDFGGLDWDDSAGKLYGLSDSAPAGNVRGLYEMLSTGPTFIAGYPGGETDIDALATGNCNAYFVSDGPNTTQANFYVYNIATAAQTGTIPSPFTGSGTFSAAAWAPGLFQTPVTVSGTLNLNDTVAAFAANRSITMAVKQGTTTIGSAVVSAAGTTSTFSVNISPTATGPATLEADGSSFLMRKVIIALTGGNVAVGTVGMLNGDVDDSGEVDAADIDLVIADFGSVAVGNTDVDVSGEVDAADIDIVIANFGGTDD